MIRRLFNWVTAFIICILVVFWGPYTSFWSNQVSVAYTRFLFDVPLSDKSNSIVKLVSGLPRRAFYEDRSIGLSDARYSLMVNRSLSTEIRQHFPLPDEVTDPVRRWQWGLLAEQSGDQSLAMSYWDTDLLQVVLAQQVWHQLSTTNSQEQVQRLYRIAIDEDFSPEACFYISLAFSELRDWQRATRYANCAIHGSPPSSMGQQDMRRYSRSSAYFQLGWAQEQLANFPEAQVAYQRSIEENPQNDRGWQRLAWVTYKLTRQLEPALSYYQEAFDTRPLVEYQLDIADLYRLTGNYDLALQWAEIASQAGFSASAALARARVFLDLNQPHQALHAAQEALDKGKSSRDTFLLMGDAYFELREYSSASDAYNQALTFDSSSVYILVRVARSYANDQQLQKALTALHRAREIAPNNMDVLQMIAELEEIRQ